MITLFACPKPFQGHTNIIQRNAIESWTCLSPKPEIILLGVDYGVAEICQEFGLIHIAEIDRNDFGTPLVNSIFQIGQARARYPIVCYINSDIMLTSDFMRAVETVAEAMPKFLVLGQRRDVDIQTAWNFSSTDWETDLRGLLSRRGVLHPPNGIDFFCFPKGLYTNIPPFAIGRLKWDNWLVWRARTNGVPVVDITRATTIVHQNHEYLVDKIWKLGARYDDSVNSEDRSGKMRFDGQWVAVGPEVLRNIALVPEEENLNIWATNWMVDQKGVLRRRPFTLTVSYIFYQLKYVLPLYWPAAGRLIRWMLAVRATLLRDRKHQLENR